MGHLIAGLVKFLAGCAFGVIAAVFVPKGWRVIRAKFARKKT